ncbi:hypothetical protein [Pseudomonas sp. IT-P260]|uniref:hypothetical protein n=1 Tax=Pseudomonas sp. IT-P260 TaxID=3026457 RepID=UPI0039DFF132
MDKIDLGGLEPDLEPVAEKLHRLARMGISALPVVGAPLMEIFNSVLESPLNRRRTETMIQIGEVINNLIEKHVLTEEDLQENEAFISTVSEVCAISLRNHQSEKLEALRNAVKNSALPSCPSDDHRQMFLNFVDVCTVTHIKILHVFDDPQEWITSRNMTPPGWSMGAISTVLEFALPELKGHAETYTVIWKDLFQRGLLTTDGLNTTMSRDGMIAGRTTKLGAELIKFLS